MSEYVWQQPDWTSKLTWRSGQLLRPLSDARRAQGRLLAKADLLGLSLRLELRGQALVDEAMQTSAIEGERLDRGSVRSSVTRRLGLQYEGPPNQTREIDGLVDMLVDATAAVDQPLTAARLCGWHAALFPSGYSGTRPVTVGGWRPGPHPMRVVSGGFGKPEYVHFEAVPWEQVGSEMADFLHWFGQPSDLDGMVRAGVAHMRMLTIHPFDDGNGRVTRAVTDMALVQDELTEVRLWSLSAQIESERTGYYRELERAQRSDGDLTQWLVWFIGCVGRALQRGEAELDQVAAKVRFWQKHGVHALNARQAKVMNRLLDAGPGGFEGGIKTRKYVGLTKTSTATAQRDLAALVDIGLLVPRPGGGRSASYVPNW